MMNNYQQQILFETFQLKNRNFFDFSHKSNVKW